MRNILKNKKVGTAVIMCDVKNTESRKLAVSKLRF
jgi:hypothetical protein